MRVTNAFAPATNRVTVATMTSCPLSVTVSKPCWTWPAEVADTVMMGKVTACRIVETTPLSSVLYDERVTTEAVRVWTKVVTPSTTVV